MKPGNKRIILLPVMLLALALSVYGTSDKQLFEKGKAAYKSKQYSQAFDYFQQAVAKKPNKAKYHYNLGMAARKLKRYLEAYEAFTKARQLDPQLKFTKKKTDFLEKLKELRKKAPVGPGGAEFQKGKEAYIKGRYREAYDLLEQAVSKKRSDARFHFYLGLAAYELKLYQECLDSLVLAESLDPDRDFGEHSMDFVNKKYGAEHYIKESRKKGGISFGNVLLIALGLLVLAAIIKGSRGSRTPVRSDYTDKDYSYGYKKRYKWKKRKKWRSRKKYDEYRDRDVYDDDRGSFNQYAAGSIVSGALDRDDTEGGYYDAS